MSLSWRYYSVSFLSRLSTMAEVTIGNRAARRLQNHVVQAPRRRIRNHDPACCGQRIMAMPQHGIIRVCRDL